MERWTYGEGKAAQPLIDANGRRANIPCWTDKIVCICLISRDPTRRVVVAESSVHTFTTDKTLEFRNTARKAILQIEQAADPCAAGTTSYVTRPPGRPCKRSCLQDEIMREQIASSSLRKGVNDCFYRL